MGSEPPSHNLDLRWLGQRLEEGSLENQQKAKEENDLRCPAASWLSGEGVVQSQKEMHFFCFQCQNHHLPLVCSPVTDPGWEVPWVAGPGPRLPVPTLWAVVRVVDRRSHTDPKGLYLPLHTGACLGAACPVHLPT